MDQALPEKLESIQPQETRSVTAAARSDESRSVQVSELRSLHLTTVTYYSEKREMHINDLQGLEEISAGLPKEKLRGGDLSSVKGEERMIVIVIED